MLPSRWTCTLMTSPQRPPFMFAGRVGQPATSRYGLGSSVGFGYAARCALAVPANAAMTTPPAKSKNLSRRVSNIEGPPERATSDRRMIFPHHVEFNAAARPLGGPLTAHGQAQIVSPLMQESSRRLKSH